MQSPPRVWRRGRPAWPPPGRRGRSPRWPGWAPPPTSASACRSSCSVVAPPSSRRPSRWSSSGPASAGAASCSLEGRSPAGWRRRSLRGSRLSGLAGRERFPLTEACCGSPGGSNSGHNCCNVSYHVREIFLSCFKYFKIFSSRILEIQTLETNLID